MHAAGHADVATLLLLEKRFPSSFICAAGFPFFIGCGGRRQKELPLVVAAALGGFATTTQYNHQLQVVAGPAEEQEQLTSGQQQASPITPPAPSLACGRHLLFSSSSPPAGGPPFCPCCVASHPSCAFFCASSAFCSFFTIPLDTGCPSAISVGNPLSSYSCQSRQIEQAPDRESSSAAFQYATDICKARAEDVTAG